MRSILVVGVLCLVSLTAGAEDLVLPAGDARRGEEALVKLRCNSCHIVPGTSLMAPVAEPPVPVVLGTPQRKLSDAQLITAILNPSHSITAAETGEKVKTGTVSRMVDYTPIMTVRQLIDIITFLRQQQKK